MSSKALAKKASIFIVATVLILAAVTLQSGQETATASDCLPYNSCWGQASAVFAQMGEMGEHASSQPTPRDGLRNLARDLYEAGVIPDDSLAALGAWINVELDLEICACMDGSAD